MDLRQRFLEWRDATVSRLSRIDAGVFGQRVLARCVSLGKGAWARGNDFTMRRWGLTVPEIAARTEDWHVTLAIGIAAFLLLALFWFPILHPFAWAPCAEAAGLRPQLNPFFACHRLLLATLFKALPVGVAMVGARLAAMAMVSATAMVVYVVFRDIFVPLFRPDPHLANFFRPMSRVVSAMVALVFLCMDPVWRAGQALTPTTVFLFLLAADGWLFLRFVLTRKLLPLYLCMFVTGILCEEFAIGFVFAVAMMFGLRYAIAARPDDQLADRFVWRVHGYRMTMVWIAGYLGFAWIGVTLFHNYGGVIPKDFRGGMGTVAFFLVQGWGLAKGMITPTGAVLAGFACLAPFVMALVMLGHARRDDAFIPQVVGVAYAAVALVSLSQVLGANPFWNGITARQAELIPSETLRALSLGFALFAFAITMMVFGVNAFCRNYRAIAAWQYPESMEKEAPRKLADTIGKNRKWRVRLVLGALALVPVLALASRALPTEREMMRQMRAYAKELVREIAGRDVIFTDGSFDCYVELLAAAAGHRVNALSMMAPDDTYQRALRLRAAENDEDRMLLQNYAVAALRTWQAVDSPRLSRVAVQLGFEYWKRGGDDYPAFAGLAALPKAAQDDEALVRGRAATEALAERLIAYNRTHSPQNAVDGELRRLYPFLLFRVGRVLRMRARADAVARRYEAAYRGTELAETLDELNYAFQKLKDDTNWLKRSQKGVLSPREGLVVGLARADFNMAADYAAKVLQADPEDARANFALGMKYLVMEDYLLAEKYLTVSHNSNPKEPAVLNNLANAEFKLGKLEDALRHAEAALEMIPSNTTVQATVNRIKEAAATPAVKHEQTDN